MTTKPMTRKEFDALFPTDDVCLEHLMKVRYGMRFLCRCNREAHYYRVRGRRCFECEFCGYQVYPTALTPFENTRTPLKDWYFVMFLFCASRNGVAAKEVERQLGVTYKTAWRMCNRIRNHMHVVDGDTPIGGDGPDSPFVEVDKMFVGGVDRVGQDDKTIVLGMAERGGDVITRVVEDRRATTVIPHVIEHVKPGSKIATDEGRTFADLRVEGYWHATVNHSAKEYVRGPVHTNTIEAFWANVKRGIKGTYVHVSAKHLPSYLGEFEFRHNLRFAPYAMFPALLQSFAPPHRP